MPSPTELLPPAPDPTPEAQKLVHARLHSVDEAGVLRVVIPSLSEERLVEIPMAGGVLIGFDEDGTPWLTGSRANVINAGEYGATGAADVADATVAIQAAFDAVTTGQIVVIPAGRHRITAPLEPPTTYGWSILGAGRHATIIEQQTNDTPVFKFDTEGASFFRIADLTVTWAAVQTGNVNAVGFGFTGTGSGGGAYNFSIERIEFSNGYLGIGQYAGATTWPIWGAKLSELYFDATWRGPYVCLNSNGGGAPNNEICNVWGNAHNVDPDVSLIEAHACSTLTVRNVEINQAEQTVAEFSFVGCRAVRVENCRSEAGTLSLNYGGLLTFSGCVGAVVDGFEVQGKTVAAGGGVHAHCIRVIQSSNVSITGLVNLSNTLTSGTLNLLAVDNTSQAELSTFTKDSGSVNVLFSGSEPYAIVHGPKQTGVPVTTAGIHAALVNLGLIDP